MDSTEGEQRGVERKSPLRGFVIAGAAFGALLLASAAVAVSAYWSFEPTPDTASKESGLLGASCVSPRDCTAVGYSQADYTAVSSRALVERWNGTKWSIERTPKLPGSGLHAVSCVSARACIAVGGRWLNDNRSVALAERWNGSKWSIEPTPKPRDAYLNGVSCVSPRDCTAVGDTTKPRIEHWNGTAWSIESAPVPGDAQGASLNGVSCVSARDCTAVGEYESATGDGRVPDTLTERWNGTEWAIEGTPATKHKGRLERVSCVSTNACFAVGATYSHLLVERWDGSTWSAQDLSPNLGGSSSQPSFSDVSCTSARACTAVGSYLIPGDWVTLAERWNGTRWSIERTAKPRGRSPIFKAVACGSAHACIAVGNRFLPGNLNVPLAEGWRG